MTRQQSTSTTLPEPFRSVASGLRRVPGAGVVTRAAEGALDKVGAVSPRGRRMVVYAGAGVLGVVGAVEWPIALTGAAVAWLTQPRPEERESPAPTGTETGPPKAVAAGAAAEKRGGATAKKQTGAKRSADAGRAAGAKKTAAGTRATSGEVPADAGRAVGAATTAGGEKPAGAGRAAGGKKTTGVENVVSGSSESPVAPQSSAAGGGDASSTG